MTVPCIIITRDRRGLLLRTLASLEPYDLDVHIVDHGSTYEPMLETLAGIAVTVHYRPSLPPRALWDWEDLPKIVGSNPYLVTDPDLVLDENCPSDWLHRLGYELAHFGNIVKVGMGIRIDDLPNTPMSEKVCAWECGFWQTRSALRSWMAPVDTTLALNRPLAQAPKFALVPAVRLDTPYLVRHLPWYEDEFPDETKYYRDHLIPGSSHWSHGGWS